MLECWQEHPSDRPTFSDLRAKFSDMLLATTMNAYMVLEVDDKKVYYTAEEDERERKDSVASTDSDSSIKKAKKAPEKPVWKNPANPYVVSPASRLEADGESGSFQGNANGTNVKVSMEGVSKFSDEVDLERTEGAYADQPPLRPIPAPGTANRFHLDKPGDSNTSTEIGIRLSLIEKPVQHRELLSSRSNPYVESPNTEQLIPETAKGKEDSEGMASQEEMGTTL